MKVLLVVAIWVRCTIMVVPTWAVIVFNATDEADMVSYSTSVESLRKKLNSEEVKHKIPVMKQPSKEPSSERFLLVELKSSTDKSIRLAIDVANLYVVGYRDKYEDKYRAHFFPDAPSIAKSTLFEGATRVSINFNSTYTDLQKAAKSGRGDIRLGIQNLRFAIDSVYGKEKIDGKDEAKFLIISIQMVSEAARFKYIENKVLKTGKYGYFTPDYKVLMLENNWGGISKAIKQSKNGDISPPLQLKEADFNKLWEVNKVNEIDSYMGLLKYEGTT